MLLGTCFMATDPEFMNFCAQDEKSGTCWNSSKHNTRSITQMMQVNWNVMVSSRNRKHVSNSLMIKAKNIIMKERIWINHVAQRDSLSKSVQWDTSRLEVESPTWSVWLQFGRNPICTLCSASEMSQMECVCECPRGQLERERVYWLWQPVSLRPSTLGFSPTMCGVAWCTPEEHSPRFVTAGGNVACLSSCVARTIHRWWIGDPDKGIHVHLPVLSVRTTWIPFSHPCSWRMAQDIEHPILSVVSWKSKCRPHLDTELSNAHAIFSLRKSTVCRWSMSLNDDTRSTSNTCLRETLNDATSVHSGQSVWKIFSCVSLIHWLIQVRRLKAKSTFWVQGSGCVVLKKYYKKIKN